MRRRQWLQSSGLVVALAVLSACASSSSETPTPSQSTGAGGPAVLNIEILNEHASAGTFTLFIEQVGGVRQSLGTVREATSPKFTFAATPGVSYTLVQQPETGNSRTSDRFLFTVPTSVSWDMNTNRLTVLRR